MLQKVLSSKDTVSKDASRQNSSSVERPAHSRLCAGRPDWEREIGRPTRYVAAYVDRLSKLCHEKDGAALMAHAYTQHGAL